MLHIACSKNSLDIVTFLISHRANINIQDKDGETPLHIASSKGYIDIVSHLISYGAKRLSKYINLQNELSSTPLHIASLKGYLDIVSSLVSHGADITIQYSLNHTAYDISCTYYHALNKEDISKSIKKVINPILYSLEYEDLPFFKELIKDKAFNRSQFIKLGKIYYNIMLKDNVIDEETAEIIKEIERLQEKIDNLKQNLKNDE